MSNFVFFGTPYVAEQTLARLIEEGFVPSLVVTNPDARSGRGMELSPSPVKTLALKHTIPVITPEKLDENTQKEILSANPEYAIVVAYGKIFPEALITAFPKGVLNVHYSLLPKHRGATPTEAAILHGDTVTGVTVQKMVRELDAGDIIAQCETPIDPMETTLELRPRLIALGADLLTETLPKYLNDSITPIPQDHSSATKCGKFTKADGLLDLDAPDEENWNKYRAYKEWPGTYFFKDDKRIKITDATLTPDGVFQILKVVPEGKKEVDYAIFQT